MSGFKSDIDEYYRLLGCIKEWQSKKNYDEMLNCCFQSLPHIKGLVIETKKAFKKFDINSIPAIEVGCRYWAAKKDIDKLNIVKGIVNEIPEIKKWWAATVEQAFFDVAISRKIEIYLKNNPGFIQNKLGEAINESGKDTSRIIYTLANLSIVKRVKSGNSYKLYYN